MSANDQQKTIQLMEELCQLLRDALAKEGSGQLETKLEELMSDFTSIRKNMESHAKSLEALVPRADAMDKLQKTQLQIMDALENQASAISSIQEQLGVPAFDDPT
ncbi:hypothetical protein [Thalassorhabdomicrobium marinisediminis]|uniref:hypothetical protein n=1 Tax=Thalassorhabdomicrobium marinisediminis TaxID=2170577 RepID=UPI0024907D85|nr:hypothetical protein [Thalassorhabdomicrobium marinisediminis]